MSLALPVDPFEVLCKNIGINEQKHYDQMWVINDESRQYIANTLVKGKGRELPTKQCWRTEDESTQPNLCFARWFLV